MRKWFKYSVNYSDNKVVIYPQDFSFAEHSEAMGGYEANDIYRNKDVFFRKYYYNFHLGRLEEYDKFLRKHIKKTDEVLSIASGRSANELKLLHDGYDITCSDLCILPCYDDTRKLFPDYKFLTLNIIENPAGRQYDGLISLSLIYLFDNRQLDCFFGNVSRSLKENGHLILDGVGSPDNLMSFFIHDVLLKFEVHLSRLLILLKNLGKRKYGLAIKHHGYRRTDNEIIEIAKRNGLELIDRENYAFLTDFARSRILSLFMKIPFMKRLFGLIGKNVPYIRMFLFRKSRLEKADANRGGGSRPGKGYLIPPKDTTGAPQ